MNDRDALYEEASKRTKGYPGGSLRVVDHVVARLQPSHPVDDVICVTDRRPVFSEIGQAVPGFESS